MDQGADALLQAALARPSPEELSDIEVDGDGSSSLSEIEDKDAEQEEDLEASDDELSNISDEDNEENDENDSEAETERLEESPNKFRPQQDLFLSSRNDNSTYEHTPSKLHHQMTADDQEDDDEEEDPLSDADLSVDESPESPKSSTHEDAEVDRPTAPTSLDDSSVENKNLLSIESENRKRKRSIMAGSGLDEEIGEPLRKRTGSVMNTGDEYAIEDDAQQDDDVEVDESNPISGNISGDEGGAALEDELVEEAEDNENTADEVAEIVDILVSPKKRGRKRRKGMENGDNNHVEDPENLPDADAILNGDDEERQAEEDNAENEGDDEAEAAQRNEEERKLSEMRDWV
jgi:hypothetical protein